MPDQIKPNQASAASPKNFKHHSYSRVRRGPPREIKINPSNLRFHVFILPPDTFIIRNEFAPFRVEKI